MDLRHLGIPFTVYPSGDPRSIRTSYYHDDVLPREFAEQHLPDSRGSNGNKDRAQPSRDKPSTRNPARDTTRDRSWLDDDSSPQQDVPTPAALVRVPRPYRHPRLIPMEFVLKELETHLKDSRSFYGSYKSAFATMTQHLQGIASVATTHMLWKDLLQKRFENMRERDKFVSAAATISQSVEEVAVVAAVGNSLDRDAAAQLTHERNLRKINKLRVISDDIARLAKRALNEHAVDDLLEEIDMAIRVLQRDPAGQGQESGGMNGFDQQQNNNGNVPEQNGWNGN